MADVAKLATKLQSTLNAPTQNRTSSYRSLKSLKNFSEQPSFRSNMNARGHPLFSSRYRLKLKTQQSIRPLSGSNAVAPGSNATRSATEPPALMPGIYCGFNKIRCSYESCRFPFQQPRSAGSLCGQTLTRTAFNRKCGLESATYISCSFSSHFPDDVELSKSGEVSEDELSEDELEDEYKDDNLEDNLDENNRVYSGNLSSHMYLFYLTIFT
ncbi:hypothetical protein EVAR_100582_1 [Eumeta japonica]|uniref:Uncharacterized protein n=1 Tax=Eumeta variegata TaxID=151549 RepID=A0A4C1YFK7_EUMVA|nr:hypothetical protein EVAR_100582_1 [Eumeta japonica]